MGMYGPISDEELAADEADHALTRKLNGPPPGHPDLASYNSGMRQPRGIKATKKQDATTHHQRTHVTDLYGDVDEEYERDQDRLGMEEDWGGRRGDR